MAAPTIPNNSSIANSQTYIDKDFDSIRQDLVNLLQTQYPEQFQDFNSVSIGMSLVDLLAYVSDMLSFNVDKKFNELFLDTVSEQTSVFRLAKTLGYKPRGVNPAVTLCDFNINVPPTSGGPDLSYLPLYQSGVQVKGGGVIFETLNEIDFSSDFSTDGTANRLISPNFNANQDIISYSITKREIIQAGSTKLYQREISVADSSTSFLEITLPDSNVLNITSVIVKPGIGLTSLPSFQDFSNVNYKYYEVENLTESKIFLIDDTQPSVNGVKTGNYVTVNQRFTKDFQADGTCKLTFGGGIPNSNAYQNYLSNLSFNQVNTSTNVQLKDFLNNFSLGQRLPANSTLYVQYRIGGGTVSNVGANTLQQVGNIQATIMGTDSTLNQSVIASTTANNILPAMGGADLPTVDEIKYSIAGNFAAQDRCITLDDYVSRVYQIPGKFGSPFRVYGQLNNNKVQLYILSIDANGNLFNNSSNIVKNNIINYLSAYRSLNDFIEIDDGKIINISLEIDLFTNKNFNGNEVKANALSAVANFFNINSWQMNETIYISQIWEILGNVPGVINVVDVRMYNMEGGNYSSTLVSQATGLRENLGNNTYRTQIDYINNAVSCNAISMFEVKFPNQDIYVRIS